MAQRDERVADAAHVATTASRAIWARHRPRGAGPGLADFRRRLELFVAALFPGAPPIVAAERPEAPPLLACLTGRAGPARSRSAMASTDGAQLRLPPAMRAEPGIAAARYRLLALEQAARAHRGTPLHLPEGDPLLRDLYCLAEAAAVDRTLAELAPGLRSDLAGARAEALAERRTLWLTEQERAVERLTATLLRSDALDPSAAELPACETPADSLGWATRVAAQIRALPGRYRGIANVALWGAPTPHAPARVLAPDDTAPPDLPPPADRMKVPSRAQSRSLNENDGQSGSSVARAVEPQQSADERPSAARLSAYDTGADDALADSRHDGHDAPTVETPVDERELPDGETPAPNASVGRVAATERVAFTYPEWDMRFGQYRLEGAVVREVDVTRSDASWANDALARQGPLVRRVRREFERLRPRRERLHRQRDGAELDVDAWVTAAADLAAGRSPDDGLYLDERPARRDAAILLLADGSGSTNAVVSASRRVIDVERDGLLIMSEALAALGDRHAIYAFRGKGPRRVELLPLKRFADPSGAAVRARIGALEPNGYTRLGAAIRHGTALLARESAKHRLLLLFSDGRPNDVDVYEGPYGLEDTRQAFAEARVQGVHTCCLTVDHEAPVYAKRVFGAHHYAVLPDTAHLPQHLIALLRRLVKR